jgi:hypothetical protein
MVVSFTFTPHRDIMNIEGYIIHKIIPRPWGIECRFTVKRGENEYNEIVMIDSVDPAESVLIDLIERRITVLEAMSGYDNI